MTAARVLRWCLILSCGAMANARADNFPAGLIQEQFEQASRMLEVDLSQVKPGELRTVEYVGRPVYVYRRTKAERVGLSKWPNDELADPLGTNMTASVRAAYGSSASLVWARLLLVDQPALEKQRTRSYKGEYFVAAGWGPQSGCKLDFRKTSVLRENAVFSDSCVGTRFDSAGRALRNRANRTTAQEAAVYNLYLPPHHFESKTRLVIGLRPATRVPELEFSPASLYRDSDPTHNLIIAARYNDTATIESALAQGADINAFRPGEGSPLDAAIIGSPIETVKMLIDRGARPTPTSTRAAVFIGRKEVWELLENLAVKQRTP
jgi:ubiquinol-cytochrome c reductase iron-sulfur subunit